jgi:hypothetical protein
MAPLSSYGIIRSNRSRPKGDEGCPILTVQSAQERPEKNRHGIGLNVASRTDTVPPARRCEYERVIRIARDFSLCRWLVGCCLIDDARFCAALSLCPLRHGGLHLYSLRPRPALLSRRLRTAARRRSLREANRRYGRTVKGRLKSAERSQRYRDSQCVTDHGSLSDCGLGLLNASATNAVAKASSNGLSSPIAS